MNRTEKIESILTHISYSVSQAKASKKEGLRNAERSYLHDISDLALELSRLTAIEWSKASNAETVTKE
jgi:hypothetical protein